ncbi:MAG: DUF4348 domain-containing protein [Prevotella sp.]|nr:DUF4348 domain-containing protein [Prevotella sp.]
MRNSAVRFSCLACCFAALAIGCKDNKPEPKDDIVEQVDTIVKADTIETVIVDTIPDNARDSLISAAPVPETVDELFDDFLFLFTANKKLQYERVEFPLPVHDGDSDSFIQMKDWKMEKFFSQQEFYTLILDDESQMELSKNTSVDSVIIETINLKAKSVEQHVFNRRNGKWMLTGINKNTMYQNQNKSFLAFYQQFASDSIFQVQSLNDPVNATIPDPEDDYAMMEGEFHPDQWDEFKPYILPDDTIYNILYGQKYNISKKKIFVIRGISNGLEIDMTFKQMNGKWKLVKIVE